MPYQRRKCSACPAMMVWALSPAGRPMPLDADPVDTFVLYQAAAQGGRKPVLYALEEPTREDQTVEARRWDPETDGADDVPAYVSHYTTCPAAGTFSTRRSR